MQIHAGQSAGSETLSQDLPIRPGRYARGSGDRVVGNREGPTNEEYTAATATIALATTTGIAPIANP